MAEEKTIGQGGQYYLIEKIAQGGMAEIYKGLSYDSSGLKKTVCIKRILPEITASKEFVDSLIDEAKIAVKLSHGNIAQIYDLGKVDEEYFMVMEYVGGKTLSQLNRNAVKKEIKLPIPHICYVIAEVANGLDYVHRRIDDKGNPLNIVHCDISPQNIMISTSGTVKIIDFGIARAAIKERVSDTGILKGKFSYMSPEQALGEPIDHRSDIYSLGIIMHELITGKRLFKAPDKKETLRNVREGNVKPPSSIASDIPEELDSIVMRALSKDRRFRYPFASQMRDEIQKYLHTHHPDFSPIQLTELLEKVFGEELTTMTVETELKTPHMIIDHTKSAILDEEEQTGREAAKIDMSEFMVEESESISKEDEITPPSITIRDRKKIKILLAVISSIIIIAVGSYLIKKRMPIVTKTETPVQTKEEKKVPKEVAPKYGFLAVTSSPSGATIFLNDEKTQFKTPNKLEGIAPNKLYSLGLWLENYKYWSEDFTIKPDETKSFHAELAIDFGSLKVRSFPDGAEIFMDSESIGKTPLDKEDLMPGKIHKIELKLEGFHPSSKEIMIKPGKEEIVRIKMEKIK